MAKRAAATVEVVIASAEDHARWGDPDHEVGDLQDFIRILGEQAGPAVVARAVARFRLAHGEWRNGDHVEFTAAELGLS